MTKIAIFGAAGRMGLMLARCADRCGSLEVTGAVEQSGHEALGKDIGSLAGIAEAGVVVGERTEDLGGADVAIDFTFHAAVPDNAEYCARLGKPIVIGTTGLDEEETARVRAASGLVPVVRAPNMSLGMNLLFSMVEKASAVFGTAYKVEINETHHVHKKDAPSGTALRLGEAVARGRQQDFESALVHEPGTTGHDHPGEKIVIHSHREGEVVGAHSVSFVNETERIGIEHDAFTREAFAMGALRAAEWVVGRSPGLYDMHDVLGL
jgi:4-hydroxy-tetrahydrodipicolinate reductase